MCSVYAWCSGVMCGKVLVGHRYAWCSGDSLDDSIDGITLSTQSYHNHISAHMPNPFTLQLYTEPSGRKAAAS